MNLFTGNSPYYHLLKYLLFLLKHTVLPESVPFIKTENRFTLMYFRKHLDFEVSPTFAPFKPFRFISTWTLKIRSTFSCNL